MVFKYSPTVPGVAARTKLYVLDGAWTVGDTIWLMHFLGSASEDPPPDSIEAEFVVEGGGSLSSDDGSVDCDSNCTVSLASNQFPLDLLATPDPGWGFTGFLWAWDARNGDSVWEQRVGADIRNPMTITSSTGFLQATMDLAYGTVDSPPRLIAVFERHDQDAMLSVTRTGAGDGAVIASEVGLACGGRCSVPVPIGTEVTLTAGPYAGSDFDGFAGSACSGVDPCTLTVSGDTAVAAAFSPQGEPSARLSIAKAGLGTGTVTSSPAGVDCGADCSYSYPPGTVVTLTATAGSSSRFIGWSGDGLSGIAPATFALDSIEETVLAVFDFSMAGLLDVTGNGTADASTDGVLIMRRLFGFSGETLVDEALDPGATRADPHEIATFIDGVKSFLDVDANGKADALSDGMLIIRYLLGFTGNTLIEGVISPNCGRCTSTAIESYSKSLMP